MNSSISDQESIVRVPLTRVTTEEKPLISENFALYKIFKNLFLPQGYPDSVSEDYIRYQLWDTIQAFCSTINGNLRFYYNVKHIISKLSVLYVSFSLCHRYIINACHIKGCWCWKWLCKSTFSHSYMGESTEIFTQWKIIYQIKLDRMWIHLKLQVLKDGAGHFGKIFFAWWKG